MGTTKQERVRRACSSEGKRELFLLNLVELINVTVTPSKFSCLLLRFRLRRFFNSNKGGVRAQR